MESYKSGLHDLIFYYQWWKDEKMVWNPSDFNGLSKIRIPPDLIWRPDIVLYNGYVSW